MKQTEAYLWRREMERGRKIQRVVAPPPPGFPWARVIVVAALAFVFGVLLAWWL